MLVVQDLSFAYSNYQAVKKMSFSLKRGDYCALLGPNGAGKSTLFKLISALLPPTTGKILLQEKSLSQYSYSQLSRVLAVVPQHQEMVFDFTVFDVVMMGRAPYQSRWTPYSIDDKELVDFILEQTNLYHLKNRMSKTLSGGEWQRTLIARAMAQQTPLILLDEPLSNLDITHKFEILELITKLNQEKDCTILMIAHDLTLVKQFVPLCLLMKEGQLIHYGASNEVICNEVIRDIFAIPERFAFTLS